AQPPSSQIRMPRASIKSMKSRTAEAVISVIYAFHEPLIAEGVVVELAKESVVEHGFPVLADDRLIPPRRLDLPASYGFDRPGEAEQLGRAAEWMPNDGLSLL